MLIKVNEEKPDNQKNNVYGDTINAKEDNEFHMHRRRIKNASQLFQSLSKNISHQKDNLSTGKTEKASGDNQLNDPVNLRHYAIAEKLIKKNKERSERVAKN